VGYLKGWHVCLPMVMEKARYLRESVELADLMQAKRELADLITKRDALLRTE
jgi:hypothetical protein